VKTKSCTFALHKIHFNLTALKLAEFRIPSQHSHNSTQYQVVTFICFINSNICSGGKLATALATASGAFSGSTGSPYGLYTHSASVSAAYT